MAQKDFVVSGRRAPARAHRPVQDPPPRAPPRPGGVGGGLRDRAVRRGRRHASSAGCTPPGYEGWTVSRYRQTGGRTPEGDPEHHPRGHGPRRRRRAGDAPEPLAVRALLRRPRALDRPRPRLQRLRRRAVLALLRPHLAPPRRSRSPTSTTPSPRSSGSRPAGFRAVLLPATPPRPYYTRDLDPVWDADLGHRAAAVLPHPDRRREGRTTPRPPRSRSCWRTPQQVNQPMTEKAAAKRMVTQAVYSRSLRPSSSASSSAAACPSATPTCTSR